MTRKGFSASELSLGPKGLSLVTQGGPCQQPLLCSPRVTASPRAPGVPGVTSTSSQRLPGSAKPRPPPKCPAPSGCPHPPSPHRKGSTAAGERWEPWQRGCMWAVSGRRPGPTGQPSPGHKGLSVRDTPSHVQSGRLQFLNTKEDHSQTSLGVACRRTLLGRPCGLLVTHLGDFSPHDELVWTWRWREAWTGSLASQAVAPSSSGKKPS